MRSLLLGIRFAVRARPSRAALIILGATLGTALLLTAAGAYETGVESVPPLTVDEQRLLLTVVVAVACPILVLLVTAARLSSTARDARAAALSRLGLSRRELRLVSGAENGVLALVGTTLGSALHLAVAAPAFGALTAQLGWFSRGDPRATPLMILLIGIGVVAAAAIVGYLPHRDARPGARVGAPTARPTWWRALPLGAGFLALSLAAAAHRGSSNSPSSAVLSGFLVGTVLAVLGLPLALPIAVRLTGDVAARSHRPSVMIAGRGLQSEPAVTTRLVAAVLAALAVVCAALCVLQAFWDVPQVRRAVVADTTGPQFGDVWISPDGAPPTTQQLARLTSSPGVRAAIPQTDLLLEGRPGDCDRYDDPESRCGFPFVGTCAELAALAGGVQGCREDAVLAITTSEPDHDPGRWEQLSSTWARPVDWYGQTPPDPAEIAVELPPVTGHVLVPFFPDDPNRGLDSTVFVPSAMVDPSRWPPSRVSLVLDGGPGGREAVLAEASRLGLLVSTERLDDLRAVQGYESMVWVVGSLMLATGLAGLAIAGADRAVERRRRVASLRAIGTPLSTLRRSQLLGGLLPLAIGAPIAAAVGGLVGAAYLSLGGIAERVPWGQIGALLAMTLVAAALTALVSLAGLGARSSPHLLRRE